MLTAEHMLSAVLLVLCIQCMCKPAVMPDIKFSHITVIAKMSSSAELHLYQVLSVNCYAASSLTMAGLSVEMC